MEGLFLVAYPAIVITLLLGSVAFSHVHAPLPRLRQAMRRLGFVVHALGVAGIVVIAVASLLMFLGSGNPFVFLGIPVSILPIWWITGGIAMRFGVRRDELFWWHGGHPTHT